MSRRSHEINDERNKKSPTQAQAHMRSRVLLLALITTAAAFTPRVAPPRRPRVAPPHRAAIVLQGDSDAEERGRAALEAMRAASADKGYDSSLQGLQDRPAEEPIDPKEFAEFKSKLTLGFAGFLIVGGILSLFVGGSLWEPKGFQDDGTPPPEDVPAFGFVPKPSS